MAQRVVILGAAGRDFHNFNVYFKDHEAYEVVAFTATQIPNIDSRRYPPELAGSRYPDGIPILPEQSLEHLIRDQKVDCAVFSYSDVPHEHVMHIASRVGAAGADFLLLGPMHTQLRANVPVVSICAARTGCGKSQTSRRVAAILRDLGWTPAVIRHPMPYGDLVRQAVQEFDTFEDLVRHEVTIEEREEYEPHLAAGYTVFAGVDYGRILAAAEKRADIIVWDGGNNDFSFYRPDLHIVVVDPLRADHLNRYHPGETNVRMADVIVINKIDTASFAEIEATRSLIHALNPEATVIEAASPVTIEDNLSLRGKRVLVVEDGPTLTHGEMAYGAGWVAARRGGASQIVDPRPYAVGSIRQVYERYRTLGPVLPAMGYGAEQVAELEETIRQVPADVVLIATPIDLRKIVRIDQPAVRARYDLMEIGQPSLQSILAQVPGSCSPTVAIRQKVHEVV